MKRFELLGLPNLTRAQIEAVSVCPADDRGEQCPHYMSCSECVYSYLQQDVPTKVIPRYEQYGTRIEDAATDYVYSDRQYSFPDFIAWLNESVEVVA